VGDWRQNLQTDGYALLPSLCPPELLQIANDAIDLDLRHNYNPDRQREYDHLSYCPDLRKSPAIEALLLESGAKRLLDGMFGWRNLRHHDGQIAIRQAHNMLHPQPPEPHIDGIPSPDNGVRGRSLSSFTALIGVFLTETPRDFAGNFTTWPGSHHTLEAHFRARGRKALGEGMPSIDYGAPRQLATKPGDVIFCHYQLAHAAAVNTSRVERRAVFFRIWLRGLALRRWHHLTHIWTGWRLPPQ